jgi:hypothetical protein
MITNVAAGGAGESYFFRLTDCGEVSNLARL